MYLLVIITRQEDKTYDFLKLLPTVGVRGATVIEGRGMGRILRDRETIFTSIEQILSSSIDLTDNVVILSLVQGGEVLASVRRLARQVFGDFARPNTGVLFVLPVADAEGLATGPDLTLPGNAEQDANV
jgi:nitrogen regulatory protein PII